MKRFFICVAWAWAAAVSALASPGDPEPSLPPFSDSAAANDVVHLQEMVVKGGAPWRYAQIPGYEILTRCSNAATEFYLRGLLLGNLVEGAMLPRSYLAPTTADNIVILYDSPPSRDPRVVPAPVKMTPADQYTWQSYQLYVLSTNGAAAQDCVYRCANLWGAKTGGSLFAPISFNFRLLHSTPTLPRWFVAGLIGPYGLYQLGIKVDPHWISLETGETATTMVLPRALWISTAESDRARAKSPGVTPLMPLAGFFDAQDPDILPNRALWQSEAALFVRWGMFKANGLPGHQSAFWQFLFRARTAPVTERMFRDCFGFGFAQAEIELRSFLPQAVSDFVEIQVGPEAHFELPRLRLATDSEVARMVGDWEHATALSLRSTQPDLSRLYLDAAGRVLLSSFNRGNRDPQFLGVLGLYEHAVGADAKATEYLAAATKGPIVRPVVNLALAQLRLADFEGHPQGAGGRLSLEQMTSVFNSLYAACQQHPAMVAAYRLMADAWAHSAVRPRQADLAVLDLGPTLFPYDSALATSVSKVRAQWGYGASPAK